MCMDKLIETRVQEWMGDKYDEMTRMELQLLIDNKDEKELVDRFYKELDFGTGGMRGVIGAGTNRMNIYTVGKSAQGIANYLLQGGRNKKDLSVVISYDSRHFSDVFSLRSALIFAGNGIKSYLFSHLQTTPLLSFAIRYLKAKAGVMVTASHNPPEYNGYKVYYEDGAQVLPPHDKGIISEVRAIQSVDEIKIMDKQEALDKGLLQYIGNEINESYFDTLFKSIDFLVNKSDHEKLIKIVYTPLHGTGNIPVREALKRMGYSVAVVPQEEMPNGDFPTVKYPNPEEADALKLAIQQAKDTKSDLVLATDPDCDRVGIAVKDHRGEFILFNGNQVGVILSHFLFSKLKEKNLMPANPLLVKTIVSTDMTDGICQDFGVEFEEVLTGFKYIAEKVKKYHELEEGSKKFLFGFEESYGYTFGDYVRDKDAVSSCLLISILADECKKMNITLIEYLNNLYRKYGYYLETLKSLTLKGKEGVEAIQTIMEYFREHPLKEIHRSRVVKIRDVERRKIYDIVQNRELDLDLPVSNVLTYYMENGSKVTLRPSGTEPKIKFYFSFHQKNNGTPLEDIKSSTEQLLENIANDFVKQVNQIIN